MGKDESVTVEEVRSAQESLKDGINLHEKKSFNRISQTLFWNMHPFRKGFLRMHAHIHGYFILRRLFSTNLSGVTFLKHNRGQRHLR